jgi:choline dehydrogenase
MKLKAPDSAGETFDYVIVGGGSAGSAIAARLSESGRHTALLLEAGKDDRWIWLRVPLGAGRVLLSERSLWRFYTEPEPHMGRRRMYWPRGRVLGGSSTINGMLWVRGEPAEYDAWRDAGCPGWGYEDVLPFLKRCETYIGGDPALRGTDGAVNVVQFEPDALGSAFHRACIEAGIPPTADYNGAQYEGVASCRLTLGGACAMVAARPTLTPRAVVKRWRCLPARARTASASTTAAPWAWSTSRAPNGASYAPARR